jgi:hypothetical protein
VSAVDRADDGPVRQVPPRVEAMGGALVVSGRRRLGTAALRPARRTPKPTQPRAGALVRAGPPALDLVDRLIEDCARDGEQLVTVVREVLRTVDDA